MFKYLFLLFLIGCSQSNLEDLDQTINPTPKPRWYREPAFDPLLQAFEELTGFSTKNISTRFNKLDGMIVGLCLSDSSGFREIQIDPDFWKNVGEGSRENLILHEAGHCVLNLEHNSEFIQINDDVIPKSIMFPAVFGDIEQYQKYHEYYLWELQSHAPG